MADYLALAQHAYEYAEQHYGDKDARFDVIVECMTKQEIANELKLEGRTTEAAAVKWAKARAGLAHEVELNQAWDGPESCIGSSKYDPAHDPAGLDPDRLREDKIEREQLAAEAADEASGWNDYCRMEQEYNDVREGL